MYARSGGGNPKGFEGGQSTLRRRLPKRGFKIDRFNNHEPLETINLGQIAYFIQKGVLNPAETITIKHLFDAGVVNKITFGVKVLGRGSDRLEAISTSMGMPISLEVSDAT